MGLSGLTAAMGGDAISPCPSLSLDLVDVGRTSLAEVSRTCLRDDPVATVEGKEARALGPTEVPKVSVGRAPPQYGIVVELMPCAPPLLPNRGRFSAGPELDASD